MTYLKSLSTCLMALALTGTAWAEIYETTDAQGNPVFSDSPGKEGAHVVDLPQTNVADAPPDIPQAPEQTQRAQKTVENNVVNNESEGDYSPDDYNYDNYNNYDNDNNYDPAQMRRELDRETPLDHDAISEGLHAETPINPAAPREVLDAEDPHTVGDFNEPQDVVDRRVMDHKR
mgnify:FL=1